MDADFHHNRQYREYGWDVPDYSPRTREEGMSYYGSYRADEERFHYSEHRYPQDKHPSPSRDMYFHEHRYPQDRYPSPSRDMYFHEHRYPQDRHPSPSRDIHFHEDRYPQDRYPSPSRDMYFREHRYPQDRYPSPSRDVHFHEHRYPQDRYPSPSRDMHFHKDFGPDPSPVYDRPIGTRAPPPQAHVNQTGLETYSIKNPRNVPPSHPSSTTRPHNQARVTDYYHGGPETHIPTLQRAEDGGVRGQRAEGGGVRGQRTEGGGVKGQRAESGGVRGQRAESGGARGQRAESGGVRGQRIEVGGGRGQRVEDGGGWGQRAVSGGVRGQRAESGGIRGQRAESGGIRGQRAEGGGVRGQKAGNGGGRGQRVEDGGVRGQRAEIGGVRGQRAEKRDGRGQRVEDGGQRAGNEYSSSNFYRGQSQGQTGIKMGGRATNMSEKKFEWDLMKHRTQQNQRAEQSNQADITSQPGSATQSTKNSRFLHDVEVNLNRIRAQHNSQVAAEFGKQGKKYEQQIQESSFYKRDLSAEVLHQKVGPQFHHPLNVGSGDKTVHKAGNPGKGTAALTKALMKSRKRARAFKRRKKQIKNREARRIDRLVKKLNADLVCPVPGCYVTSDLKQHAYKVHLPKIFNLDLPISYPDLHSMRWQTLRELTMYILGAGAHVEDLLEFMRSKNVMPPTSTITQSLQISMKALCRHQGWKIPPQFTIQPPNSPAILLHWRALLGLLQYVTPSCQQQFKSAFAKATIDGMSLENLSSLGKKSLQDKMGNIHQSNTGRNKDSVMGKNMVSYGRPSDDTLSPERPALMDSHFYFGRLCMLFDVKDVSPSELLSNLSVHAQPRIPVNIIGGAMVYSNPKSFSLNVFPSFSGWRNCFGVDALNAPNMQEEDIRSIGVLTNSAEAALGDIGLDRSAHKDLWMDQEVKFKQLLSLSTPAQPMILKITGPYGDPYGFDVSSRVRDLVRRQCGRDQHVHLCNFKGDELMVKEWLEEFSNCYFGFSRIVLGFDEQQVKGLQAVPDDRLLLESNVPLSGEKEHIIENSPLFLGEVASAVATIRNNSLENIAHKTVSNTCRLYNL